MTNEELEKLRKKYKELEEKRLEVSRLSDTISEYEQLPSVKTYLKLVELYKNYTTGVMYGMDKMTNEEMAVRALTTGVFIENTSNIYVYNGTYMNNTPIETSSSISVVARKNLPYDSQLADYSEYKKIESVDNAVRIPISDREQFEKENIVLFLPEEISFEDVQGLYLNFAIHYDLEKAKEMVLVKSNVHNRI